ncbi:MAG: DNA lyase [Rhodocyclales bacterium]|nr:DNA lyase [Rhodocyclales bacterium]
MRLWSLHPRYLDPQGLVALWREALLAQAVHDEAEARGYRFDRSKFAATSRGLVIPVTSGQMDYEWGHLMAKLRARNPEQHQRWGNAEAPESHPLFRICPGEVASWERPLSA